MLCVASVCARTYTPADVPNVHVADSTRYVSNPDGVLSPQAEARLNAQLASLLGHRKALRKEAKFYPALLQRLSI